MVVIRRNNLSSNSWQLDRVVRMFPAANGRICFAEILTQSSIKSNRKFQFITGVFLGNHAQDAQQFKIKVAWLITIHKLHHTCFTSTKNYGKKFHLAHHGRNLLRIRNYPLQKAKQLQQTPRLKAHPFNLCRQLSDRI